jgi:hypothetical protein
MQMSEYLTTQTQTTAKPAIAPVTHGLLQRCTATQKCDECRKIRKGLLQRAAINSSLENEIPSIVDEVLCLPGQPLDTETRAFMESHFRHDFSKMRTKTLQTTQNKLTVNEPGDEYEQEADRIADVLIGRPLSHTSNEAASLTRPDFSQVRIHAGAKAAESARAINALAYTVGRDIVFGASQYAPREIKGRQLLVHELTHVMQQTNSTLSASRSDQVQRAVDSKRVSCERYPRTYPIFTAIGTVNPAGVIQAADIRAIQMLDNVINELTDIRRRVQAGEPPAWPLISDALAASMRDRLRLDSTNVQVWTGTGPGTVEIIIRWFSNVRAILNSGRINYTCLDPDCDPDDWASAITGNARIFLCRLFWRDTFDPVNGRALTLIHEAAHIYYGLEDSGSGAGNAHCLEQFMTDANGVTIHPDSVGLCQAPHP